MRIVLICAPIMDLSAEEGRLVPIGQDSPPSIPNLAVHLLAGVLRNHDHAVSVLDLTAAGSERIDPHLPLLHSAQLVGISATTLNWPTVLSVAAQLRKANVAAPLVLGGIHPTMFPDYILRRYPVDFIIRSEGERALLELCRALQKGERLNEIGNLSWRTRSGQVVHNDSATMLSVEEMTALPLPAYDLLTPGAYPTVSLQSSRGCAFNCCFCSTSFRRSYRGIPPSAFVEKLVLVQTMVTGRVQNPHVVEIVDDEWSLNRKRTLAILEELDRRGVSVKFTFDSRANDFLDSEERYVAAVAPRMEQFLLGAECGYDEGLKRIGKGTTVAKLEACARLLRKYGIAERAEFSFILGLPWETKKEVLRTVQFAAHLALEYGVRPLLQWYYVMPGSLLWRDIWRTGAVTPAMYDEFGFFRNLYLFKTGVGLAAEEMWDIMDIISTTKGLLRVAREHEHAIQSSSPTPMALNFPLPALGAQEDSATPLVWQRSPAREADRRPAL